MRLIPFRSVAALLTLTLISLVMAACHKKTINEILAEPQRYVHRDAGIVGTVVQSYSVLGKGAYQVDDGTGTIWVVSYKGVPRTGARIGVKGKIYDGVNLGSLVNLPDSVRHGLVMIATKHRAKN